VTNSQLREMTTDERVAGADGSRRPELDAEDHPADCSAPARCGGSERQMMSDGVRADVLLRLRKLSG